MQVMEGALGVGSEEVMDRDDSNFYVVNGLDTVHDVQVIFRCGKFSITDLFPLL